MNLPLPLRLALALEPGDQVPEGRWRRCSACRGRGEVLYIYDRPEGVRVLGVGVCRACSGTCLEPVDLRPID